MRSSENPQTVMFELVERAEMMGMLHPQNLPGWKPGQFVLRQPPEVREVLKRLKSSDIARARWPLWK